MKEIKKILEELKAEEMLGIESQRSESETIQIERYKKRLNIINNYDFCFNTFDDPVLKKMLKACKDFCIKAISGQYTFLVFSGPTEVGKTHLIKKTYDLLRSLELRPPYINKGIFHQKSSYLIWEEFVRKCLSDQHRFDETKTKGVIAIEEFLPHRAVNNFTNFSVELAFNFINARLGKITLIDTNKSLDDIQEIDPRIASRFFRNEGMFVDIPNETKNYLSRCSS